MDNLDFLIPESIIDLIEEKTVDLELVLTGAPCQGRYPKVKIHFNNVVVFDDTIIDQTVVKFTKNIVNLKNLNIGIEYYNKLAFDTYVDKEGKILENQSLKINNFKVNDYDIVEYGIIYGLGKYSLNLSEDKKQYFIEHNIDMRDNHSLEMFENGQWNIELKFPIAQNFCNLKSVHLKHELWPNQKLLNEIYQSIKNIRSLELNK